MMMASVSNEIAAFLAEAIKKSFCGLLVVTVINSSWGKTEKFSAESKVSPLQNNSSFS
nr:hypothetical protein [Enterococcus faecalis]